MAARQYYQSREGEKKNEKPWGDRDTPYDEQGGESPDLHSDQAAHQSYAQRKKGSYGHPKGASVKHS